MSGASRVINVHAPAVSQLEAKDVFSGLLPAAMYLKAAFGPAAWHQERREACLIVDDPLLKERYGFLNFKTLVGLMDSLDFTTSIGFIPWILQNIFGTN